MGWKQGREKHPRRNIHYLRPQKGDRERESGKVGRRGSWDFSRKNSHHREIVSVCLSAHKWMCVCTWRNRQKIECRKNGFRREIRTNGDGVSVMDEFELGWVVLLSYITFVLVLMFSVYNEPLLFCVVYKWRENPSQSMSERRIDIGFFVDSIVHSDRKSVRHEKWKLMDSHRKSIISAPHQYGHTHIQPHTHNPPIYYCTYCDLYAIHWNIWLCSLFACASSLCWFWALSHNRGPRFSNFMIFRL